MPRYLPASAKICRGNRVSLPGQAGEIAGGEFALILYAPRDQPGNAGRAATCRRQGRSPADGGCRGILLQATAATAAARKAILNQWNMAALSTHAVHPVPDFPVQNDARAHPRAQGQHAHRVAGHLLAHAALPLRQGSRIGIAFHDHRRVQFRLHCIFKHEGVEAGQVGRPVKSSRRQLQRPRSPDPNSKQFILWSALLEHAADGIAHVVHHGLRPINHAGGHIDKSQPLPFLVEGSDAQIGASQVDTDRKPAFRVAGRWWCVVLPGQTVPPLCWNSAFLR